MKLSTKQYAKKQIKWIKNRLIPAINASSLANRQSSQATELAQTDAKLYLLNATGMHIAYISESVQFSLTGNRQNLEMLGKLM